MSNSLILDNIELIDSGNGYQLLGPGANLGAGTPDTATIEGTILDGDRVTGARTGNRQIELAICVIGTSRLDLSAKVDALISIINSGVFELTWTPDDALPIVFDCYRGTFVRDRNFIFETMRYSTAIILTFPAAPFGHSPDTEVIPVPGELLVFDDFDTAPDQGATLDTTVKYQGSGSANVDLVRQSVTWSAGGTSHIIYSGYIYHTPTSGAISRTFASPIDMTSFTSIGFRFRWPAPPGLTSWRTLVTLALTDGTDIWSNTRSVNVPPGSAAWYLVKCQFKDNDTSNDIDFSNVTQYGITITTDHYRKPSGVTWPATSDAWIDVMQGYPDASITNTTPQGNVLIIPDVKGSARTPVNLIITQEDL